MMSIAFKEGIRIPPPALNEIILASNQDVRQVKKSKHQLITSLRWLSCGYFLTTVAVFSLGDPQSQHVVSQGQGDDVRPVQVRRSQRTQGHEARAVWRLQEGVCLGGRDSPHEPHRQVGPLFPRLLAGAAVRPGELPARAPSCCRVREATCFITCVKLTKMSNFYFKFARFLCFFGSGNLKSHLVLLSKTADSICDGDLVDRRIRSGQNWSLLPTQVTHTHIHTKALLDFLLIIVKVAASLSWEREKQDRKPLSEPWMLMKGSLWDAYTGVSLYSHKHAE